jgi:lysophospholipase L1-like esterase
MLGRDAEGATSAMTDESMGIDAVEGLEESPSSAGSGAAEAPPGADEVPAIDVPEGPFAGVHLVGRMDESDPAGPRFAWSGAGAIAVFEGSSLGVTLRDSGGNQFTVVVDGQVQPVLVPGAGTREIALATGLAAGEHRVEIYRRTEASFGVSQFLSFDFGPDGVPGEVAPPSRRIELIGDSVSSGYGNLGTSVDCGFSADTQSHYDTYGAIAARELGAELSTVAWSGKGVVYNYDTDVTDPMPALYGRALPSEPSSQSDFAAAADAVVIKLGTNDFSTAGDPAPELFPGEYLALLDRVRQAYPDAFILCTVGPLLGGQDLQAARAGIAGAVQAFTAAGGSNAVVWEMNVPNNSPGCDYHPSLATHAAMAEGLVQQLAPVFDSLN